MQSFNAASARPSCLRSDVIYNASLRVEAGTPKHHGCAAPHHPAFDAQSIDRTHGIGQTKPVFVHRLIARGTIKERILSLQDKWRPLAAT